MALILVVDDEAGIREVLRAALRADGHRVVDTGQASEALRLLGRETVDLLITDLSMPEMDGIELLQRVAEVAPEVPSIVVTAFGSKESAIEAMRQGAVNYLEKPFDVEEMQLHVRRALGHRRLSDENRELRARLDVEAELIGRSAAMEELRALVGRIAPTDSSVLITGESGSGKEVVARAVHRLSARADKPFVGVNCGAIPPDLLESELFGHVKGAFTGAERTRRGLFEAADGGTLFLDEIGDMPPEMQVKLLRVLQERRIRRVGGAEEIPVDVRVVTATHRDLDQWVREGRFREDLYYRINVIRVRVPPLRERLEDLHEFVRHFALKHGARMGRGTVRVGRGVVEGLTRHRWPGNVRELENVVERMLALSTGDELRSDAIPAEFNASPGETLPMPIAEGFQLEEHLERQRRDYMRKALVESGGVQKKAARLLGMTFRSFRYFAKKYGLLDREGGSGSKGTAGEAAEMETEPVASG